MNSKVKQLNKLVLITIVILLSQTLFSQENKRLDSLLNLVKLQKDTILVNTYIGIGKEYENLDFEKAKAYYQKASEASEKSSFFKGQVIAMVSQTGILNIQGKFDDSNAINKKVLQVAMQSKNVDLIAKAYNALGTSLRYSGKQEEGLNMYLEALKYAEKSNNKKYLCTLNSNISGVYFDLGQFDKSLKHLSVSEKVARENQFDVELTYALSNKAISQLEIFKLKEAEITLNEALLLSKKINNDYLYLANLINMSNLKMREYKFEELKKLGDESLEYAQRLGSPEAISMAQTSLGLYYLHQKQYALAQKYGVDGLKSAQDGKYTAKILDAYELLSNVCLAKQDMDGFVNYSIKRDSLESVVNQEKIAQKVEELNLKYETEKKEQQILLQKEKLGKRNIMITVLLVALTGLLIIGLLYFNYYRLKQINQNQKIKQLETDKQLLATESVIKGEEQERTRLAKDLHDGLGGMLSGIKYSLHHMKGNLIMTPENATAFERSLDMLDSSIQEMRRVAHNMMPEALVKFGLDAALRDFCNDIHQSGKMNVIYQSLGLEGNYLEQSKSITVYRIIQELVNNALKHSGATETLVQVSLTDENLSITVEDNGNGFDVHTLQNVKGMGWSNIQNRVDFLKGTIDVHTKKEEGTSVLIEIKLAH